MQQLSLLSDIGLTATQMHPMGAPATYASQTCFIYYIYIFPLQQQDAGGITIVSVVCLLVLLESSCAEYSAGRREIHAVSRQALRMSWRRSVLTEKSSMVWRSPRYHL